MPGEEAHMPHRPTIEAVLAALRFDEREGRPGPKAPRLNARLGWQELVRVLVRAELPLDAEVEEVESRVA